MRRSFLMLPTKNAQKMKYLLTVLLIISWKLGDEGVVGWRGSIQTPISFCSDS